MGQAKRRGTREERVEQAAAQRAVAFEVERDAKRVALAKWREEHANDEPSLVERSRPRPMSLAFAASIAAIMASRP